MFFGQLEGTGFEVLDPRFQRCIIGHARVERLWTGARWSEGPAWFAAGRYLLWSDIPNNRILRLDECNGAVSSFREPSNNSNGNPVDHQGRLVSCEHLTRRVTRTEHDGSITVLSDNYSKVRIPELVANLCFGGPRLNRLFICGTTSLYSVYLAINGQSRKLA